MDLKATIASGYRIRLILIAAGALLYAAWAFYDATIGYPEKAEAFQTYLDLQRQYPDDFNQRWAEIAQERGWDPDTAPDEIKAKDIPTQWVLFGITFPVGSYCLVSLLLWTRRYVGADSDTLYSHGGVEVPFSEIKKVDATRWDSKGIALITYEKDSVDKVIVIDDWKYERAPSTEIYDRIRDNVDEENFYGLSDNSDTEDASAEEEPPDQSEEPVGQAASDDEPATSTKA